MLLFALNNKILQYSVGRALKKYFKIYLLKSVLFMKTLCLEKLVYAFWQLYDGKGRQCLFKMILFMQRNSIISLFSCRNNRTKCYSKKNRFYSFYICIKFIFIFHEYYDNQYIRIDHYDRIFYAKQTNFRHLFKSA